MGREERKWAQWESIRKGPAPPRRRDAVSLFRTGRKSKISQGQTSPDTLDRLPPIEVKLRLPRRLFFALQEEAARLDRGMSGLCLEQLLPWLKSLPPGRRIELAED